MNALSKITNKAILEELKLFPLQAVVCGILEKNNQGRLLELPGGSILITEESDDPFVFLAGPITPLALDMAISIVAHASYPMVYCHPKWHHLFLKNNWDFHLRAEMMLERVIAPLDIGDEFTVRAINSEAFFKQCFWYKETAERYGSPEQFLRCGKGYALCNKDGQVLSEAYTDYIGDGYVEIGIVTHPSYRNQGFGAQVASHLISKCLEANMIPIWSCQINNRASMQVAHKIGFSISRYYMQMVPSVGNTLGKPLVKWIKDNPDWE